MMTALRKFIEKEGLTQADAAKRLKVSQPRISDLTRGKISRFSLDTLVNMLSDAGLEVDFRIKPPSRRVALPLAPVSAHYNGNPYRSPATTRGASVQTVAAGDRSPGW
jgi:predicted XRE-type DNA-binding protein